MSQQLVHSTTPPGTVLVPRKRILLPVQNAEQADELIGALRNAVGGELCDYRAITALIWPFQNQCMFTTTDALRWLNEYEQKEEEARRYLSAFCRQVSQLFPDAEVTWSVIKGDPQEVIVEEADGWQAAMIIMTAEPLTGWRSLFKRSLPELILRKSRQTVQIVKPEQDVAGTVGEPLLAP